MARDLNKLSVTEFELMVWKVPNKELINLYKQIHRYKKEDVWNKLNPEYPDHFKIIDALERKTTILEKEMQSRGMMDLYNQKERKEFIDFRQKNFWKKSLY